MTSGESGAVDYVELHAHSAYSFLDGASQPEELAVRAAELGYPALALTDHDGVYGSLEFAHAAKHFGVRPITGAELTLADRSHVTVLVETPQGYSNLCRLITAAHAHTRPEEGVAAAGGSRARPGAAGGAERGLVCLSGCARARPGSARPERTARLARAFGRDRFFVELQRPYERGDARRNAPLRDLAESLGVPTIVTGDVHAHHPRRAPLQDVLVAVRHRSSLEGCEAERRGNHECVLLSPAEMRRALPGGSGRGRAHRRARRAAAVRPDQGARLPLPRLLRQPRAGDRAARAGLQASVRGPLSDAAAHAATRGARPSRRGAEADRRARPGRVLPAPLGRARARARVRARGAGPRARRATSLPPGRGRGSSVGSLVCYLTGLSHVDPVGAELSLGRFLNRELDGRARHRPRLPARHPREADRRASPSATAASTQRSSPRSRRIARAARSATSARRSACRTPSSSGSPASPKAGTRSASPRSCSCSRTPTQALSPRWRAFARALPRDRRAAAPHLAAPGRNGDLVAAARRARPGAARRDGRPADVPVGQGLVRRRRLPEDRPARARDALRGRGLRRADRAATRASRSTSRASRSTTRDVYDEIQRADTVGDFQIESRAQMQSLLRTRPENLDDLTVQVALVRPGPIQGKAVHPYIEHRQRLREDPSLRPAGRPPAARRVPALDARRRRLPGPGARGRDRARRVQRGGGGGVAARDEPQAQRTRRSRRTASASSRARCANGVDEATADLVYDKLVGFSGFGFPKSHAAAFGLLAYQSAWLRHHYPAEFLCSLLNAQPMGFYPPATLVRDAQRRGVETLPPDVNVSAADARSRTARCASASTTSTAIGEDEAKAFVEERERGGPFDASAISRSATPLSERRARDARSSSGACDCFGLPRRDAPVAARARAARGERARLGRRGEAARAPARPDRGDAGPARADGVGADARRLPHDEPLGRRPSARAPASAPAARGAVSSEELERGRTARRCRSRAWRSRGSGRRPRTASCSC